VAANDLVLLRTNNGTFATNASNKEVLTPDSLKMFRAIKSDTLGEYIAANPSVVTKNK
jgi:hypothetical protein